MIKKFLLLVSICISAFSCADGPMYEYGEPEFNFLQKREVPFYGFLNIDLKSVTAYNSIYDNYVKKAKEENLKLWAKNLDKNLTTDEIYKIVYKAEDLDNIKNKDIKEYLLFAQKQQYYTTHYYFNDKPKQSPQQMIDFALEKIEKVKQPWLKLRYFYLAFRLAQYKNQKALEIYKKYKYLLKNSSQNLVKDWIQALYAGALVKNKEIVKGVYNFTKLFDNSHINSYLSIYNFYIKTNKQYSNLEKLAKNNDEKIKLILLRVFNSKANITQELENISLIDKNSKWFDLLLYRTIYFLQTKLNSKSEDYYAYNYSTYDIPKLKKYLQSINKKDMDMVNLSLAYLNLFEQNYKEAKRYANLLKKSKESQTLKYIIFLNTIKKVDKTIENEIFDRLNSLKQKDISSNIFRYTFYKLKKLYIQNGDDLQAYLVDNIHFFDTSNLNLEQYYRMQLFFKKSNKSKLQNFIVEQIQTYKKDINDAYTHLLINSLNFKGALETNSSYLDKKVQFNPFNSNIRGNNRKGKEYIYSVREILEKIVEIKKMLNKNPNSAMDNYLYANLLYNLSYFGNANKLATVYRSTYSFPNKDDELDKINKSIFHYKEALKNANKREFKAKILYSLAKSELALYRTNNAKKSEYSSGYEIFDDIYDYKHERYINYINKGYGKYFDILSKKYENTKYYKEVLKECYNLRLYTGNN